MKYIRPRRIPLFDFDKGSWFIKASLCVIVLISMLK